MTGDGDDKEIIVRCARCADGPYDSPFDVVKRPCSSCGAKVWVEKQLPGEVARMHPGKELKLVCWKCEPEGDLGPVEITDGQIDRLLAAGQNPKHIAQALAIAVASSGRGTLEENAMDIALYPESDKAKRYRQALLDMTVRVGSRMRRN